VGDLEISGAGEAHEDTLLITPETAAVVDEAVRRWRGWDQGCVLSVFASVYPYHLACHAVCKKRPGLRIAAYVDDTYLSQSRERLYKDFRYFKKQRKRLCDLESNEDKLKAVANSTTKVGSVKERAGDYDDALRNKKALVIPMILEAFGGISPHSLHFIRRLAVALRAKGARARDSTVYGGSSTLSSTSAKSFFVHHTQQLAAAAQVGDAKGIRKTSGRRSPR
jgi:hypothetical protein